MRKTSQAALLVLLEQDLIERGDMEEHVCPVIIQLSCEDSSDDYRTEAVAVSIIGDLALYLQKIEMLLMVFKNHVHILRQILMQGCEVFRPWPEFMSS